MGWMSLWQPWPYMAELDPGHASCMLWGEAHRPDLAYELVSEVSPILIQKKTVPQVSIV